MSNFFVGDSDHDKILKTWVDPPSGWKYNFPKYFLTQPDNFNQWLLDNGYPEKEIQGWPDRRVPCRMWIEEN